MTTDCDGSERCACDDCSYQRTAERLETKGAQVMTETTTPTEALAPLEKMMRLIVLKAERENRPAQGDELAMYEACRAAFRVLAERDTAHARIAALEQALVEISQIDGGPAAGDEAISIAVQALSPTPTQEPGR